jgi:signal transduction histidine kinase
VSRKSANVILIGVQCLSLGFTRGGANGKIREGLKMAWTWSAPQRGTVAKAAILTNGERAVHRITAIVGRGDTTRGLSIICAAFLTMTGAAVPNLAPVTLTALLFLAGAALVVFASLLSTAESTRVSADTLLRSQPAAIIAPPPCLQELLQPRQIASACDRAAFARLSAHMSHELRTPLNAIIGFSEMMSNEVFGPLGSSSYTAYARDIHTSGMSLLKSAEDALAITALLTASDQQHRSGITNAASAATEALAFHAPALASRGITASCTIDTGAEILADAQAVRQILINLIAAASVRAADGASLSLASRQDNGQFEILISISGERKASVQHDNGFSMLLARTLSELSSAHIIEDSQDDSTSGMHIAVRFHSVTQNDFFSRAA